jgi:hypothetical protein
MASQYQTNMRNIMKEQALGRIKPEEAQRMLKDSTAAFQKYVREHSGQ